MAVFDYKESKENAQSFVRKLGKKGIRSRREISSGVRSKLNGK